MNTYVHCIEYPDFTKEIIYGDSTWAIFSAINFEECSKTLCKDIIDNWNSTCIKRIKFYPIRLVSRRSSPWSPLELVKEQFQSELRSLASEKGIAFNVTEVEFPAGQSVAYELLVKARKETEKSSNLVLDISAFPREFALYLCDIVCGIVKQSRSPLFPKVLIVLTPPGRITSRNGLGPFSVGAAKCVYNPELLRSLPESIKASLLIFPGYEGFEAKAAVDAISGHNANISVAVSCFDISFPNAINVLIANQAILSDAVEGSLDLQYYFSEFDAFRVARDFINKSIKLCFEFPNYRHLFLVATFGPKWSIVIASLARVAFLLECKEKVPDVDAMTDVLVIPTSQYVSLYSRSAGTPCIFEIPTIELFK